MILRNKKGAGYDIADMFALIFTIIILTVYIIFIVLGSFKTGEIESVINSRDDINSYNNYISLINYLDMEIQYDLNGDNVDESVLMSDILKEHISTKEHNEIIEEKTVELLDKLAYCYRDDDKIKKVGFMIFLSNGDKWDNIPFYKKWKVSFGINQVLFVLPKHLTEPTAYQRLTKEDFVFLYMEEGIRVDKEECDNLE